MRRQENSNKIPDGALRKELTQIKQTEAFQWLYDVSNNVTKQAIKDLCKALDCFHKESKKKGYKHRASAIKKGTPLTFRDFEHFPRFKSKRKAKPSFYQANDKLKVKNDKVLLEKIGWVALAEKGAIPTDEKYLNPRVSFDGKYWYLSVGIEQKNPITELTDEVIGIDVGIKELTVCSNGQTFKNINKTPAVRKTRETTS